MTYTRGVSSSATEVMLRLAENIGEGSDSYAGAMSYIPTKRSFAFLGTLSEGMLINEKE